MAKSGGRPKPRKEGEKADLPRETRDDKPYTEDKLIRALNHAVRRQILRLLHSSRDPLSPSEIVETLDSRGDQKRMLSIVSYHCRVLAEYKVISPAGQRQVRGAMQHFYVSGVSKRTAVRRWLSETQESDKAWRWAERRSKSTKKQ